MLSYNVGRNERPKGETPFKNEEVYQPLKARDVEVKKLIKRLYTYYFSDDQNDNEINSIMVELESLFGYLTDEERNKCKGDLNVWINEINNG